MKTTCVFNVVSAVVAAIVAGGGVACANPSEEEEYLSFYISNHDQSPAHRKRRGQAPRNADFSGHLRSQPHRNAKCGSAK